MSQAAAAAARSYGGSAQGGYNGRPDKGPEIHDVITEAIGTAESDTSVGSARNAFLDRQIERAQLGGRTRVLH